MTGQEMRQTHHYGVDVSSQDAVGAQSGKLRTDSHRSDGGQGREQLATALGWFSIGLGAAELVMPHQVAHVIGIRANPDNQAVLRAVGLREIASGIGLLSSPQPTGWLKARVGGDVMDLALLGSALNSQTAQPDRVAMAIAAVAGISAVDWFCCQQLSDQSSDGQQARDQSWAQLTYEQPYTGQQYDGQRFGRTADARAAGVKQGIHVRKAITVNRTPEELYQFWHNFENLPRFMYHLDAVQVTGDRRSHWQAKAPAGLTVEWDAEITADHPNESIAWRSLEGATVPNAGTVHFTPAQGGRGTVVAVELQYDPPGGAVGAALAKLFGEEPEQQIQDDLRIFKQVMETGDVVRSDASLWGPSLAQRPGQPPHDKEYQQLLKEYQPLTTERMLA